MLFKMLHHVLRSLSKYSTELRLPHAPHAPHAAHVASAADAQLGAFRSFAACAMRLAQLQVHPRKKHLRSGRRRCKGLSQAV